MVSRRSTTSPCSSVAEMKAPLHEVFASIQGEGRYVGRSMVFVRVAVCPIRCRYCDTPQSYDVQSTFEVRNGGRPSRHDNPVPAATAADLAAELATASPYGPASFVSLTGGEPLLYPGFVAAFGAALRSHGLRLFLETAALDPEALRQCLPVVDHLSADYKLPGTLSRGDAVAAGKASHACVAAAIAMGRTVDVKMVLTDAVQEEDLVSALATLAPMRGAFELVLQPVTPALEVLTPLSEGRLARFVKLAAEFDPLVLPQMHKQLGLD